MEKTIRTQFVKEFLEAVLTLESVDECMDFFEDVCTVKEVQSVSYTHLDTDIRRK